MTTLNVRFPATAPIPPAIVAAVLDCLAFMPDGHRLAPTLLMAVTRTVTTNTNEADALLVRIRAAAIILCDPRWQAWSTYFRASTPAMHRAFDVVMLDCVATLPLDGSILEVLPRRVFRRAPQRHPAGHLQLTHSDQKNCSDLTKKMPRGLSQSRPHEPPVG